jgi:hypothetical protein
VNQSCVNAPVRPARSWSSVPHPARAVLGGDVRSVTSVLLSVFGGAARLDPIEALRSD